MKTKEKTTNKGIFALAKALSVILLVPMLLVLGAFGTSGAQRSDFLAENYDLAEHYSSLLAAECGTYSGMDTSDQKEVSKNVVSAINLYRKKLLDLQSHPDASLRLLSAEAKLAYAQGLAVGRIAWIYRYNISSLKSESAIATVQNAYAEYLAEIERAADGEVLDARADVMCRNLNNLLYREMIGELAAKNDSLASSSIIAGGLSKLSLISSDDLLGREHANLYVAIKKDLLLQRTRDALSSDLEDIFSVTHPGEDHQNHSAVALFVYKLKNAGDVSQMNSAMLEATSSLIEVERNKIYSYLYVQKLSVALGEECVKASKEERAASLLPFFENYPVDLKRASYKDDIRDMTLGHESSDAEFERIEKVYNADGGRLDLVSSAKEFENEFIRAKYTVECYKRLLSASAELSIILGKYENNDFSESAIKKYEISLTELDKISGIEFEKSCLAVLDSYVKQINGILNEAKAERYLLDHRSIISKPDDALSTDDEIAARHALDDYTKLPEDVAKALTSQVLTIAEKYNIILSQKIRAYMLSDALYLDLCENICNELQTLSKNNIAEFYNNCDLVLKKAETLCAVIISYRELCGDELYQSYNASEREDLVNICRSVCVELCALDVNDKTIFESELEEIQSDARLALIRINEIARVRIAMGASDDAEIKAIFAECKAKILASFSKSDIISLSQKAIFKINRLLCAEKVEEEAEKLKYEIEATKFLSTDEKRTFVANVNSLMSAAVKDALVAENTTVLSFIWTTFSDGIAKERESASALEITRSRENYLSLFEKEVTKLQSELRTMLHLTSSESDVFFNKTSSLLTSFKSAIASAKDAASIAQTYSSNLDILHSIKLEAENVNLDGYKEKLRTIYDNMKQCSDKYSVENYNRVLQIISDSIAQTDGCGSISACDRILEDTKISIGLINDLLDDAKQAALASLESKVSECMRYSSLYSPSAVSAIEEIMTEAKRHIDSFSVIESIPELERAASIYLDRIRDVRRDYVTNSQNGLEFISQGAQYPLNHNTASSLWGLVMMPGSLPSDAELSIVPLRPDELDGIRTLLKKSIRNKSISFFGGEVSSDKLALIRKGTIALGVDITLSDCPQILSPFNLQLLLPQSFSDENVLGVVFIKDDGSAEFYSVLQRDLLISLDLSHLSKYYVITESTLDLSPLIIFLTVLIGIEMIALVVLLIIRRNRKRKENDMFPLVCASFVNPLPILSLAKIRPEGAITTVVFLSVAALAAGCALALLLKAELSERKSAKNKAFPTHRSRAQEEYCEQAKLASARRAMLKPKRYELEAPKDQPQICEDSESEDERVLCAVAVKLDDGDNTFETVPSDEREYDPAPRHRFKYELNLDVIAQKFDSDDLITLELLKRKHLVPKKADYLKILARGALSKPLTIEANDFSRAAEEMLTAVGGRAIRIKDREQSL